MKRGFAPGTTALLLLITTTAAALAAAAAPSDPAPLRTTVYVDREALVRGQAFRAAVVLDLADGYHVNANPPTEAFQIPTVLTPEASAAGVTWGAVQYPAGRTLEVAGGAAAVYGGRTVLRVEGRVEADAPLGEAVLRMSLSYQGCNRDTCYPPAELPLSLPVRIVEAGTVVAPAHADVFAAPAASATEPAIHFEGESDLAGTYARNGFLYFGLLFLGGLLLNLTPCVFPLIPVTMSVFAQQGERRPLRVLPLAALYVAGLAATFTVVGVLAALAGQSVGAIFREPVGVLVVVAILAVLMASTFGAFEIQLPAGAMGKLGARRGAIGAAVMGMVMGAGAAPCVGPFLLALLTFIATTGSVALGAASFFVTGLGLGLPYLFLGLFTGLINRFPRGGGWMVWTKRLMGLALAGVILWFVKPFFKEEAGFFWPLVLGVGVFAAVYLGVIEGWTRRPLSRRFWAVRIVTALAILAAGIGLYRTATAARPEVAWTEWTPGALAAAQAEGRPALLYFGADWCAECVAWHYSVFSDPAVIAASEDLARVSVDVTRLAPGPKQDLARKFGGENPPVVIVFGRDGHVVRAWRAPPPAAEVARVLREATAP